MREGREKATSNPYQTPFDRVFRTPLLNGQSLLLMFTHWKIKQRMTCGTLYHILPNEGKVRCSLKQSVYHLLTSMVGSLGCPLKKGGIGWFLGVP